MQRNIAVIRKTIDSYLERNSLSAENPPWEIKRSKLGGFGLFATRPIEIGDVIFKDHPVILGPRCTSFSSIVCVNCYSKEHLTLCSRHCGLYLCSEGCQNSPNHQKECKLIRQWRTEEFSEDVLLKLFRVLTPIRSLFLSAEDKDVFKCLKAHTAPQHGSEVNVMKTTLHLNLKEDEEAFMRFVCSVMDSNSFEVIVGNEEKQTSIRGVYPLASLANHCCAPNTIHVFDEHKRMIVRASVFIPQGEEIFHSYCRMIWGTPTRRYLLSKTKHFLCQCRRCLDPTEFGSYMNAIMCKNCKTGKVIPMDALCPTTQWQCEKCGIVVEQKEVASITSLLGSILNSFDEEDVEVMLRFIENKLPTVASKNHEALIEAKYRIIWIFGYKENYTWGELCDHHLITKETYCKDLLEVLEILRLGQCKMRGLLLYELYRCHRERKKRKLQSKLDLQVSEVEMMELLFEASNILKQDVGAPEEVKMQWAKNLAQ